MTSIKITAPTSPLPPIKTVNNHLTQYNNNMNTHNTSTNHNPIPPNNQNNPAIQNNSNTHNTSLHHHINSNNAAVAPSTNNPSSTANSVPNTPIATPPPQVNTPTQIPSIPPTTPLPPNTATLSPIAPPVPPPPIISSTLTSPPLTHTLPTPPSPPPPLVPPPPNIPPSINVTSPSSSSSSAPIVPSTSPLLSASLPPLNMCNTCHQEIRDSQFIRVSSFKFHKDHFLCSECSVNLHGQKFHHKDGHFYCPTHYMEKFCQSCRHCGEKISTGNMIQAFGHYYHPEHFVCHICSQPFQNGKYYEQGEHPYCEIHFQELTLERCEKCKLPVKPDECSKLGNKVYHSTCLSCHHCQCLLGEKGQAFTKDGRIYCQQDYYNLYCKRCSACGEVLLKSCISVNQESYHPACLACDICHKTLDKYICVNGHLRCQEHADAGGARFPCARCGQLIDDGNDIILSVGKKFHTACYRCIDCNCVLEKQTCKLRDGQVCCTDCLMKASKGAELERKASAAQTGAVAPISTNTGLVSSTPSIASPASAALSPSNASSFLSVDTATSPPNRLARPNPNGPTASPRRNRGVSEGDEDDHHRHEFKTPDSGRRNTRDKEHRKASRSVSSGSSSSSSSSSSGNTLSPPPPPPKIDWKKGELIGKGSFGKVYMGMNIGTGELIAVKQVRLNTTEELEQATAIQNEIALMENLRHPNIVCFLGTQRSGNKLNILMEFVPGKSLDFLLEKFGALYEKVIRSYTKQLLEALAYCHANHVVHRDIKGKNILIDTKGNLKLADFGSAKRFQNVMSKDAPSLSYNYTPLWTAPEVLTGDYNSKVDIWSLGCVIIEMASAKPPWSEQNFENPFRALYHIGNTDTIPAIPHTLSDLGQDFVRRCLTRDPDVRKSAAEMLQHEWLKGIEVEMGQEAAGMGSEADGSGSEGDEEEDDDDDDEEGEEEAQPKAAGGAAAPLAAGGGKQLSAPAGGVAAAAGAQKAEENKTH